MVDNHIHYIKEYEGSAVIMDQSMKIIRKDLSFSIEYKPLGTPEIKVKIADSDDKTEQLLVPKILKKISKMDGEGVLAQLHK